LSCLIIVLVAVHLATPFFLDINCTPLEELVDEIITGGSEAGEIDAMAQDEEANGHRLQVQHELIRFMRFLNYLIVTHKCNIYICYIFNLMCIQKLAGL